MNNLKIILISGFLLSLQILYADIYISEVVNNTNLDVYMTYPVSNIATIIRSLSIMSGDNISSSTSTKDGKKIFTLSPFSITYLKYANIPLESQGGVQIEVAKGVMQLRLPNVMMSQHNRVLVTPNCVEMLDSKYRSTRMLQNELNESVSYTLEINGYDKLALSPSNDEKLAPYINPKKISAQEFLHQAIVNDSGEDIERAIKLGADINNGIANQAPLLMAILLGHKKAIDKLLKYDVDPNIVYQQKHIIFTLLKSWDMALILDLFKKGANLSKKEKEEVVSYIMIGSPFQLNEDAILVLKKCDYNISVNFNSTDLAVNKWYNLLVKHNAGTHKDKPVGYAVLPSLQMVELFLKYGANPNQLFILSDGTEWTPILLALENYRYAAESPVNMTMLINMLKALLINGANINQAAKISVDHEESPLSYALKYDDNGFLIDFLVKQGASIEMALDLFLKNGGSPTKMLKDPLKYGPFSLLWWAVDHNNPKAVQLLIDAGVKNTAQTIADKSSPLNLAITKRYDEIIKILMSN